VIKPAVTRLSEGWKSIVNGTFPKSISISPLFFQSFYKYSMPVTKTLQELRQQAQLFCTISPQCNLYTYSTRQIDKFMILTIHFHIVLQKVNRISNNRTSYTYISSKFTKFELKAFIF
jgi:hypothetical protein